MAFLAAQQYLYLLRLRQITMAHWRDARGGSQETIPEFRLRLCNMRQDAANDKADVPFLCG